EFLQLWCYSRIVDEGASAFTVHNEVIGNAILPFKRAKNGMRIGVLLETLYYRVKTTNNPTHWMVGTANLADERREEGKERRWREEESKDERKSWRGQEYNKRDEEIGSRKREERYEKISMNQVDSRPITTRDWNDGVVEGDRERENTVKKDRRVLE
ncbi:hypothetical protein PFISCL1PPCAC_16257, partial [Pristionchus fissidentatus]